MTSKSSLLAIAVGAVGLLTAGCGVFPTSFTSTNSKWMSVDQNTQTVTLNVIAGYNRANAYDNLNGFANGQMVFNVPQGYTVKLNFINASGIPADIGVYNTNGNLAFKGAGDSDADILENPQPGVIPGASETLTFTASTTGTYRIENLINRFPEFQQTQQSIGMWAQLNVVPNGTPSVQTTT